MCCCVESALRARAALEDVEPLFPLRLALEGLEVLCDGRDGEEDACPGADGADEVREDGEDADAEPAERRGGGDVLVEDLDRGGLAEALDDHLLVLELLGDVLRRGAGDLDPRLGEDGARGEDEDDVEDDVDGVEVELLEPGRRREVVDEPGDGVHLPAAARVDLPRAEEGDDGVGAELLEEELRDEERVGDERGLQHDRDVRGVEQLDRVGALLPPDGARAHLQVDVEALEVDHERDDDAGREQVRDVGEVRAEERLLERAHLVRARDEEVEEGDDRALELLASAGVDRVRRERTPDDVLADVGRDEQRDARAEPVALLQQLVEHGHDDAGERELDDDQEGVEQAEVLRVAVHAGHDVRDGLPDGHQEPEELLGAVEERAVLLAALVHLDDLDAGEQLHDHARGDDGRDAEVHQRAAGGRHDDTHPVERVVRVVRAHADQRDLAAHEEDEQRDGCPQQFLTEGHLPDRGLDLRHEGQQRLAHLQEAHSGNGGFLWLKKDEMNFFEKKSLL